MALPIGYEFVELSDKKHLLGIGSFAQVRLARSIEAPEKLVAVKIIDKRKRTTSIDRENLVKEVQIHSQLSHPHIIAFLDAQENDSHLYIILEHAPKGSLFSFISKRRRIEETDAKRLFYQCALAIAYLHDQGLVHRDFKPENVLLDNDLNAKLCDFGWTTDISQERGFPFCGTYEYMAPEMVSRERYGKELDVWALGVLLFEMLNGHSPFRGSSTKEVLENIKANRLARFKEDVPNEARELITAILRPDPLRRPTIQQILKYSWFTPKLDDTVFHSIAQGQSSVYHSIIGEAPLSSLKFSSANIKKELQYKETSTAFKRKPKDATADKENALEYVTDTKVAGSIRSGARTGGLSQRESEVKVRRRIFCTDDMTPQTLGISLSALQLSDSKSNATHEEKRESNLIQLQDVWPVIEINFLDESVRKSERRSGMALDLTASMAVDDDLPTPHACVEIKNFDNLLKDHIGRHFSNHNAVSYTHLTLPTIYSV
eukprot:TRINITY_DN2663_c0_g1_i6.p1 TRINITY_DN2663_c0_g1~~TRINITY_DN2663_c0_g1_i6.p1  ORF type:complete len:489 (-),score=92.88 TRINITY_DN2663_c0_g1_i6:35-1501(-)